MLFLLRVYLWQFHKFFMKTFKGDNCAAEMMEELLDLASSCISEMQKNKDMIMTSEDWTQFKCASHCHICGEGLGNRTLRNGMEIADKIRDHDHRTGKYRGAAHSKCNINYFANRYLPVVFHNYREGMMLIY